VGYRSGLDIEVRENHLPLPGFEARLSDGGTKDLGNVGEILVHFLRKGS
jgi:hypothetical protein